MKKPMKFKRYNGEDGSEVEESKAKQRGLDISNKDAPMGFFERLRMGNIDDPTSEAYKRLGAGRGRSEVPAEKAELAPEAPAKIIPRPSIKPNPIFAAGERQGMRQPSGDASVAEDYSGPRTKPIVREPVSVNKPSMAKKPAMSPEAVMEADNPRVGKATYVGSPGTADRRGAEDMSAYKPRRSTNEIPVGNARRAEENQSKAPVDVTKLSLAERQKLKNERAKSTDVTKLSLSERSKLGLKSGGSVSSASRRADGIATKGKTRGKMC